MIEEAKKTKSYSELSQLSTYEDRYNYLKLDGQVGVDTFGFDRCFNQQLYKSKEWRDVRNKVILRDNGCDLGVVDNPIGSKIIIHHINPITMEDIEKSSDKLFDLDNLICVSMDTHNAIHYGIGEKTNQNEFVERRPNDTCPWRK